MMGDASRKKIRDCYFSNVEISIGIDFDTSLMLMLMLILILVVSFVLFVSVLLDGSATVVQ